MVQVVSVAFFITALQILKGLREVLGLNKVNNTKYEQRIYSIIGSYQHVFRSLHWLEADEGDLHREDGADDVDCGVCDVNPVRECSIMIS